MTSTTGPGRRPARRSPAAESRSGAPRRPARDPSGDPSTTRMARAGRRGDLVDDGDARAARGPRPVTSSAWRITSWFPGIVDGDGPALRGARGDGPLLGAAAPCRSGRPSPRAGLRPTLSPPTGGLGAPDRMVLVGDFGRSRIILKEPEGVRAEVEVAHRRDPERPGRRGVGAWSRHGLGRRTGPVTRRRRRRGRPASPTTTEPGRLRRHSIADHPGQHHHGARPRRRQLDACPRPRRRRRPATVTGGRQRRPALGPLRSASATLTRSRSRCCATVLAPWGPGARPGSRLTSSASSGRSRADAFEHAGDAVRGEALVDDGPVRS